MNSTIRKPKDAYFHSANGQKVGSLQGPIATDDVAQTFLLRMKFATKRAFIEVLNPSTKLYRNVWTLKKCKKKLSQLRG